MKNNNLFNSDERILMNSMSKGTKLSELSRTKIIENIVFARSIANDNDVINLLESLYAKVTDLSDKQWNSMKMNLPFETSYEMEEKKLDEVLT